MNSSTCKRIESSSYDQKESLDPNHCSGIQIQGSLTEKCPSLCLDTSNPEREISTFLGNWFCFKEVHHLHLQTFNENLSFWDVWPFLMCSVLRDNRYRPWFSFVLTSFQKYEQFSHNWLSRLFWKQNLSNNFNLSS